MVNSGTSWSTVLLERSVPMWKELILEGEIVRISIMILSFTLSRNAQDELYIRHKTHTSIVLRFLVVTLLKILILHENFLANWLKKFARKDFFLLFF